MKTKVFILLFFGINIAYCQPSAKYDKKIIADYSSIEVLEAPFMVNELIEIYKTDSLVVKKAFNREAFNRTEYTLYCYNVCADFFYNRLIENRNNENREIVDKIISEIDYEKNIIKSQIDWSNAFKTCLTCPFGEYPDDRFFYFKFSIMFMGELEIKQMAKHNKGEQWGYMLDDIKYGDLFTLNNENYFKYVLDRRIANYIIERWRNSDIKEIQELVAVCKNVI